MKLAWSAWASWAVTLYRTWLSMVIRWVGYDNDAVQHRRVVHRSRQPRHPRRNNLEKNLSASSVSRAL
jgi:hypothetical protein